MKQATLCLRGIWVAIFGRVWRKNRQAAVVTFKCVSRVVFRCQRLRLEWWLQTKRHTNSFPIYSDQLSKTCTQSLTSVTPINLMRSSFRGLSQNWSRLTSPPRNAMECKFRCAETLEVCHSLLWWPEKQSSRLRGVWLKSLVNFAVNTIRSQESRTSRKNSWLKLEWM